MTDPFYHSNAWRELRYLCLKRDHWHCTVCERSVRLKGSARVDHIIDRRERPDLALMLSNLRTLCASCDNKRHAEKGGRQIERPEIALDGLPKSWR
jgi:5-methylcytosine-specific restriction endonuclease McrA